MSTPSEPSIESVAQPKRLRDLALLALALLPIWVLVAEGALLGPLWLDEVNYFHYAERWEVRESAPHTPVTNAQGTLFSMFAYPNVLRVYLATLRGLGLDWRAAPELLLRLPSLAAFVVACALAYWAVRRRGKVEAMLLAGAMASIPLFQFYAFEGKVYALAGLVAVAQAWTGWRLTNRFEVRGLVLWGLLSLALPYFSVWTSLCLAPLPVWFVARALLGSGRGVEALLVIVAVLPGVAMAGLQAYWLQHDFAYQTDLWFSDSIGVRRLLFGIARDMWAGPVFLSPLPPVDLVRLGIGLVAAIGATYLVCLAFGRRTPEVYPLFHFVIVFVLLLLAVPRVRGFVTGRYEVPIMFLAVFAAAGIHSRARIPVLAALIAIGSACLPWTLDRLLHKSNTRSMIELIRQHGDIGSEAILTRYAQGWDPLHRYTAHFYAQEIPPAWQAVDYPTLEELGGDFMMFGSIARSPESVSLLRTRDNPAIADWLRSRGLRGLWVLSPQSEDVAPLTLILARAGFHARARWSYPGHPDTWLVHYQRDGG